MRKPNLSEMRYHAIGAKSKVQVVVEAYATFYGNPVLAIQDVDWAWLMPSTQVLVKMNLIHPNPVQGAKYIGPNKFTAGKANGVKEAWMSVADFLDLIAQFHAYGLDYIYTFNLTEAA